MNKEKIDNVFIVQLGSRFCKDDRLSENYSNIPFYNFECSYPASIQNLLLLSPYLKNESVFLVIDDINLNKCNLDKFIEFSKMQSEIDGVVAIKKNENENRELYLSINEAGYIQKFSSSKNLYKWSTASLYYFQPTLLDNIEWALDLGISTLTSFLIFLVTHNRLLKVYTGD